MTEFIQDQCSSTQSIETAGLEKPIEINDTDPVEETTENEELDSDLESGLDLDKTVDNQSNIDPEIETSMDPEIETSMDPEIETSMDPEIEIEQDLTIPSPPPPVLLTPEEIAQAKLCQQCKAHDWKYTCPRCHAHTCSLACVKSHKLETSCSGIRDKTAYVPLRLYNESNMMSDYTYLEDVSRQSDNLTRSRMDTSKDLQGKAAENRAKMFSKSAIQMGVDFSSLPVGMSRHKLNQSNYSKNLKQIFWSLEVNFCRGDKKERYLEHSFPSGKPFHAFFDNLLFSESPIGKGTFGITRHQLKDFIDAGMDEFVVALKKEKAPRGHFIDVSNVMNQPFKDVLKNEKIIEYPIFYIWLKSDGMPNQVVTLEEKKQLIAELPVKIESVQTPIVQEPLSKEEEKEIDDDILNSQF